MTKKQQKNLLPISDPMVLQIMDNLVLANLQKGKRQKALKVRGSSVVEKRDLATLSTLTFLQHLLLGLHFPRHEPLSCTAGCCGCK